MGWAPGLLCTLVGASERMVVVVVGAGDGNSGPAWSGPGNGVAGALTYWYCGPVGAGDEAAERLKRALSSASASPSRRVWLSGQLSIEAGLSSSEKSLNSTGEGLLLLAKLSSSITSGLLSMEVSGNSSRSPNMGSGALEEGISGPFSSCMVANTAMCCQMCSRNQPQSSTLRRCGYTVEKL
ncbi:hypothetical protein BDY21DRAFT_330434 [Lineolata rhizophorae]|uniref:Uncharacterized protein n=1 Tax=Lineolata rhizophorae TaxID=578093 RepID=A0A6A6PDN8_9PEZI|nr:hypothetical protein BDY21DRAFT_330434 [Lineolata rhizophorae]